MLTFQTNVIGAALLTALLPLVWQAPTMAQWLMLIGVGEGVEDLQPFDARAFSRSLVGLED